MNLITKMFYETLQQYFKDIGRDENFDEPDIEEIARWSTFIDGNIYLIDFLRRRIVFAAADLLLLCGRPPEEMVAAGYDFYSAVIHSADLRLLAKMHHAFFELISGLKNPFDLDSIAFNIRIKDRDAPLMVRHKVTPLRLTKDGKVWLAICRVTHSVQKESGNLCAHFNNGTTHMKYSDECKKWQPFVLPTLDETDRKIMKLLQQGKRRKEIADAICLSESAVKNRKTALFEKFDARNDVELISKLSEWGMR